jgi:hypothetical protein
MKLTNLTQNEGAEYFQTNAGIPSSLRWDSRRLHLPEFTTLTPPAQEADPLQLNPVNEIQDYTLRCYSGLYQIGLV